MTLIEEIREYWNLRSSGFSDFIRNDIDATTDKALQKMEDYLKGYEVKDVLDLGCGPGFYTMMFRNKGLNVIGIDYSEMMIEEARKNAAEKGIDADFRVMDAQNMVFPDSSFDLVVSRDVFWCLEHPEKAYSEILRVLRPGGLAIISDGNYYLHLYNEDYAKSRKASMELMKSKAMKEGHDFFNKDRVDFKIIEEVAKELPLSREERPRWDVGTLCRLGCNDISLHVRNRRVEESNLVFSFDVIFVKEDVDGN